MSDDRHQSGPQNEKLEEILANVPEDERAGLARTWDLVGEVGGPSLRSSELDSAYSSVEDRLDSTLSIWRRMISVAALFILGAATGVLTARYFAGSEQVDTRDLFMVLVRHEVDSNRTPEEQAEIVSEFAGWAGSLAQRGHLVSANELSTSGDVFRLVNGEPRMVDLDLTESSPTGYFLLRAQDYDEAAALVQTCPFLERGGMLELRPVIEHQ